ncbi:MAG: MATE family efflux transporter [Clostridiales bacterium]|nr:MATE family efflux transporter [Clostridiales bacterium]
MNLRSRLGTRKFYRRVLGIAIPMMMQNGLTNFVNTLDNLMIGSVGTTSISGVAIANQLVFIYYLLIFGATAGVGIFTAQFFGNSDEEGVRNTFRFKVAANLFLAVLSIVIYAFFCPVLISQFLQGEGSPEDAANTLQIGVDYMRIILISLIPIGLSSAYSGTLRDTGYTKVPMVAAFAAISVNLVGNALLIYGLFGLPRLGANGAAIATVISRFVELSVLAIYTRAHSGTHTFIRGAFRHFMIPRSLCSQFILKALPLMANETLWSVGITVQNQCYSYRSLDAVAAINIETTIYNLFSVAFVAMGEAIGIIVGQQLGAGKIEEGKDTAVKMRDFTVFLGAVFGLLLIAVSPLFPRMYNTTDAVKHMATVFIIIVGIYMPLMAYTHASYFIIRAGGNTFITFLFDSCFVWVIAVPLAYCLSRYTALNVHLLMICVMGTESIKCIIGGLMVRSGMWAKNIVK